MKSFIEPLPFPKKIQEVLKGQVVLKEIVEYKECLIDIPKARLPTTNTSQPEKVAVLMQMNYSEHQDNVNLSLTSFFTSKYAKFAVANCSRILFVVFAWRGAGQKLKETIRNNNRITIDVSTGTVVPKSKKKSKVNPNHVQVEVEVCNTKDLQSLYGPSLCELPWLIHNQSLDKDD